MTGTEQKTSAHTPGPWVIVDGEIQAEGGAFIAIAYSGDDFPCLDRDDENAESIVAELQANGRLIAAAPDLLEALKKFDAFFNDLAASNPGFMGKLCLQNYAQMNEALLLAPAAIAKATGKEAAHGA